MKKPAAKAKPAAKPAAKAAAPPAHAGTVAAGGHAGNAPAKAAPAKKKPPVSAKVKAARHAAAVKAVKTRAANAAKARKLSLGEGVACCAAEALAASLRLTGWPVTDEDVLALYLRTTRDLDAGAPILATLEAASEYGLAGVRPAWFEDCDLAIRPSGAVRIARRHQAAAIWSVPVILGVELPDGPHAVLDTGSEWITWGQAWPVFPGAVIEEAWTAEWPEGRQSCT